MRKSPKAWQLIERFGWCQGHHAVDSKGESISPFSNEGLLRGLCISGACMLAYGYDRGIEKVVELQTNLGINSVTWNDDPKRTKEEVIALLKELDI